MKSEVRIDKWLWAMRVFKTRTIATDACKKGRVTMGGVSVKPSRTIKVGDIIDVKKPPITYTFRVLALTENRLGAKLVPDYLENITPQSQYDLLCRKVGNVHASVFRQGKEMGWTRDDVAQRCGESYAKEWDEFQDIIQAL